MDKLSVELRKQIKRIEKAVLKVLPEAERVSVDNNLALHGSSIRVFVWLGDDIIAWYDGGTKTTKQIVKDIQSGELMNVRG
jgi:hypothetical protein